MKISEKLPSVDDMPSINVEVELQNPCNYSSIPSIEELESWSASALQSGVAEQKKLLESGGVTLVVRVVDDEEGLALNQTYREKPSTTNILSFPYEFPEELLAIPELQDQPVHLGDLVVCESVVNREAKEQNKTAKQHWAHLIVHGVLHLQGYDHIEDDEAELMEALEIKTLDKLGFKNPYS
ncbi:rRNA maturation RNase YbeY [Cocleimonas flava]|uniref:Endoribonuclease YbeY n=1 Tax=Cocleimonas flava TaxID=634765 RepID=A0A4R1EYM8_9GAMM|nr:rRNA maturation RNase YbeY [Cocleimonas flava]TCJ85124.1 putative rRNA maturation factor [Cocleimonas flava]